MSKKTWMKSSAKLKVNKTKGTEIGLYVGNKCQILNDYDKFQ